MKKIWLLHLFLACSTGGFSQNEHITLTFIGEDAGTHHYLPLETVYIQNATYGCDTTIFGATPSFVLNPFLGIDASSASEGQPFSLAPPVPNPFAGQTTVAVSISRPGLMHFFLADATGRILARQEQNLCYGNHLIGIAPGMGSLLFLSITDGKEIRSVKLMNLEKGSGSSAIAYLGTRGEPKSALGVTGFVFRTGDQLLYKSVKNGYYDKVMVDSPEQNSVYTFELTAIGEPIEPSVTTIDVTGITQTTATSGGIVANDGGSPVTARGVCWSTAANPTTGGSHTTDGSGTGSFASSLTGLTQNTTYYVRAYATNSVGTAYGNQETFTTNGSNPVIPTVTTTAATDITQTTAASGGNVTAGGGAQVTARGLCWSTSQNPTTAGSHTSDGTGTGVFTSNLTGLTPNTLYYIRAYATNSVGTAYGNQLSFTTNGSNPVIPTVTTTVATDITQTTATSGGNVTSGGGLQVTARGICWGTSQNPSITGNHTSDGIGTGVFSSYLTGLTPNTLYYIRAYATNSIGTAYGIQLSFTTQSNISLPEVSTAEATAITQTTATSGGNVTSGGGGTVTARGVCWGISQNPTIAGSHTTDGSGTGSFISDLTGLTPNTQYYARAYATNGAGTAYGNEISFTTLPSGPQPCAGTPTVVYEGKTYNTVQIGVQCWLRENLNVGTRLNSSQNQDPGNGIKEKYCYEDLESNCTIYGGIYQWDEMMQGSTTPGVQGICPPGWHCPADTELTIITTYLGGVSFAGGKMKATGILEEGTGLWHTPNYGATNESGFTALPGGYRYENGNFTGISMRAYLWTSSQSSATKALSRNMNFDNARVNTNSFNKPYGFSVRCVRDN